MNRHLSLLLFMLYVPLASLEAQISGTVNYEFLGIQLTIPDGWFGQEYGEGILCGSNTVAGFLYITTHPAKNLEQLRQEAQTPIQEGNGTSLAMSQQLETIGKDALGGEFQGSLEFQPIKAYMLGSLNPYGNGVLVFAATSPEAYSPTYRELATSIYKSIKYSQPKVPPVVNQWKDRLSNSRLTYMSSYSSYDYSNPNITTGGSMSSKEEIDLCGRGYFLHSSSNSLSVTGGANVSGYSNGQQAGNGTWTVISNGSGQPVLQLNFYNGEVYEYTLSSEGSKTFLNGSRYYLTNSSSPAEYRPNCF